MKGHHPRQQTLHDYYENNLRSSRSELVRDHLMDCDQCAKELEEMAYLDTAFRKSAPKKVSVAVKSKIFKSAEMLLKERRAKREHIEIKIKKSDERRESWRPWLQFAAIPATVLLLIVIRPQDEIIERGSKTYDYRISPQVLEITSKRGYIWSIEEKATLLSLSAENDNDGSGLVYYSEDYYEKI